MRDMICGTFCRPLNVSARSQARHALARMFLLDQHFEPGNSQMTYFLSIFPVYSVNAIEDVKHKTNKKDPDQERRLVKRNPPPDKPTRLQNLKTPSKNFLARKIYQR